jgi:hypothetical protein
VALTYSSWSPPDMVPEVEAHVRAYLSAVADPDDDETTFADEVRIRHVDPPEGDDALGHENLTKGGVLVVGELDAEADAPYLRPGFTPEQDIAANPLTVESIEEQP